MWSNDNYGNLVKSAEHRIRYNETEEQTAACFQGRCQDLYALVGEMSLRLEQVEYQLHLLKGDT